MASNPFEIKHEIERYDKFRPKYHHIVFELITNYLDEKLGKGLDIACGTGHSSLALREFSDSVIGCDPSGSMLEVAQENQTIEFVNCPAEKLPFPAENFDFLNISMGFHWVEQEEFLNEARRVLKNSKFLSIDNYKFSGKISDDKYKQELHENLLENHLPYASKKNIFPDANLIRRYNFQVEQEFTYSHFIFMDENEFGNLLMTWSNFLVQKKEVKKLLTERIRQTYAEIFNNQRMKLEFQGKIVLLRKEA